MPEEMGYYYDADYHHIIGSSGEAAAERWARQLQIVSKYKAGGSILDIGCSSGGFLASLKSGPWKLYGIEASQSTAERARKITGAEVFSGDVLDANFSEESFDVITCSDVMEHLYEPDKVFRQVSKWLKPDGIFYVFVPNIQAWESRMFGSYWWPLDLPRHLHHFSRKSLATLAGSANLQPLTMATPIGSYIEHSSSILLDTLLHNIGIKLAKPLNLVGDAGIGWRLIRKGLRISVVAPYSMLASRSESGPSIQAVFQKQNESRRPSEPNGRAGADASKVSVNDSHHEVDKELTLR
jgi:2-polyprenyl-3-methyl-5-hydroxy-6-metoxy-1,4-benzoquinol methylase